MAVRDYGQDDGAKWDDITVFKAHLPDAGIPVFRFIHPRWTKTWAALRRADADVYYTSCAGMHVGLLAMFCQRHNKKFIFRSASDTDCDKRGVRIPLARDRWLYRYGLERASHILVQSASQQETLKRTYGLESQVAGMLVEQPPFSLTRDLDVLWVGNIREVKRPDRMFDLADALPEVIFHMVGGPLVGAERLYTSIEQRAKSTRNLIFYGRVPYRDAIKLFGRARLLVNTSDVEGFPNTYLQAWMVGVPVITRIDPDGVIEREGLGLVVHSDSDFPKIVTRLLANESEWHAMSERCKSYVQRKLDDSGVLAPYFKCALA